MSREIEVKVLGIDLEILEERIKSIGGKLLSVEEQKNIIFNTYDSLEKRNIKGYLRIRETTNSLNNNKKSELTFKENIKRDNVRENIEIESKIEDSESMIKILDKLGYSISSIGYKKRVSYRYEKVRFDLDTWDKETYPYPYMEIEVEKEEDLKRIMDLLKIDEKNITTKSILELKKEL